MNDSFISFALHETGYNHIKSSKVGEDASGYYSDDKMHICAVSDGHGSSNYPRTNRGAQFAIDVAINCIKEFVKNVDSNVVLHDEDNNYILLIQLAKSILNEWYRYVEKDYRENPFELEELTEVSEKYKTYYLSNDLATMNKEKAYGCTLIAFAVTKDYSFGLQIGDGKCVLVDQYGHCFEPIPWDDRCQMNITTSICDSDAIDAFRFCVMNQFPLAVFCGSDGVEDSYTEFEELAGFYRSILKVFAENGVEEGKKELQDYLPVLTKKGSGDDLSVAFIINMQKLKLVEPIIDLHIKLFTENMQLEEKKASYERERYKKEALVGQLNEYLRKEVNISSVAEEIDKIGELQNILKSEIQQMEQEIASLNRQIDSSVNEKRILLSTSSNSEKMDLDCTEIVNSKSEDQYFNEEDAKSIENETDYDSEDQEECNQPVFKNGE